MEDMVEKAIQVALDAHRGQKDKGGKPYILHALHVMSKQKTCEEKQAGVLHDVLEDSKLTAKDLRRMGFSETVIEAVVALTKQNGEDYLEDFIIRVKSNRIARKVKIADIFHNLRVERLPREPNEKDVARIQKYRKALTILLGSDHEGY